MGSFLRNIPSVCSVHQVGNSVMVEGVTDSETSHIKNMVSKQKTKSKRGKAKKNAMVDSPTNSCNSHSVGSKQKSKSKKGKGKRRGKKQGRKKRQPIVEERKRGMKLRGMLGRASRRKKPVKKKVKKKSAN